MVRLKPDTTGVRRRETYPGARRGGHVTLRREGFRGVLDRLWERGVLPDYRDPGGLRVGLSPLSTSFEEVRRGLDAVRATLLTIGA